MGSLRACPSAHVAEERPELLDEQLGLLESGEVAAAVELAPVAQVAEAALGHSPGKAEDLLWEDRAAGRRVDRRQIDGGQREFTELGAFRDQRVDDLPRLGLWQGRGTHGPGQKGLTRRSDRVTVIGHSRPGG